ncbi:MAG: hypothetical protein IJ733_02820 [Lachnospiraceae bacterium]|nr:hypothetical protein [Lachnospiraceae bacterium]
MNAVTTATRAWGRLMCTGRGERMFRKIREQMSGMSREEKVEHYLTYYGWRTLGVLSVTILGIFLLVHFLTKKEVVSGVLAVNGDTENPKAVNAEFFDDFLKENGYNPNKVTFLVNAGLHVSENLNDSATRTNMQTIYTLFETRSVDVFFADGTFFEAMGQSGFLADLRDMLPDEILETYEADILYVTVAETGKKIAAGLRVRADAPFMQETGWYEKEAVVGISEAVKDKKLAVNMVLRTLEKNAVKQDL